MTQLGSISDLGRLRTGRMGGRAAFFLQSSIIVVLLAASSAPTPLYAVYQQRWGFSPITITVVFGVYALAVLAALVIVGSLSDYIGRRPVLLAALVLQAVALVAFVNAGGVSALIAARVVQGVSTGLAAGAVGAGLLDLDRARGAVANAIVPAIGTATGALVSGLLVTYLPAPTRLVYVILLGVVVLQGLGVLVMTETAGLRDGALASLWPRFGFPVATRRPLLVATPALIAAWALAGFYGSLGPSLVHVITGSDSAFLGGLALFVLAGVGAMTVFVLRNANPSRVALVGTAALVLGVTGTLISTSAGSEAGFFIATAIAGVGFGGGFQGAVRTVLPLADSEHRAGVLSVIYVISYLAMGIPAVGAGALVAHTGSLTLAARAYGIAAVALAAVAFVGLVLRSPKGSSGAAADSSAPMLCPQHTSGGTCAL